MSQTVTADSLACLSMHQPWASLLVYGIKRIEGRSWPTDFRGRLWIHSTAKEPDEGIVEEMEEFYRAVHAMDGNGLSFPEAYPTGVLLGSVDVVDCLPAEELTAARWPGLLDSLRLEVGSEQCFLCQAPLRLVVLQQMRGSPKIWALPKKVAKAAAQALRPPPALIPFTWSDLPPRLPQDEAQPEQRAQRAKTSQQHQQQHSQQAYNTAGSVAAVSEPLRIPETAEEAARHLRAARKKLRQIEGLQALAAAGTQLNQDQTSKLARAPALIKQITDLEAVAAALTI